MGKHIQYNENDSLDIMKPIMFSGQGINFNNLTDRNFEVLLYLIFKDKIERTSELSGEFDKVMLMNGVRDSGQDCALFYKEKQIGLIQCKRYNSNICKILAIKEILKFILYSIIDQRIFSLNEDGYYAYYFAVSKGFANTATQFLAKFNALIINDSNLQKWTTEIIKQYALLSKFTFEKVEKELKEKLLQIKIQLILPEDINCYLRTDQQKLLPMFFSVETVINKDMLDDLKDFIVKNKPLTHSIDEIKIELSDASKILNHIPYSFSGLENSHINRPEVEQISTWILSEETDKTKNTALVVGVAGCGKSVIMRDILLSCQDSNIPVLGLKSDKQKGLSLQELTNDLNFTTPIVDSIRQITASHDRVVLLIDQIDALSQYLSANRGYISTYIQLISSLQSNKKVKIIISTRKFDLDNDPSINGFKKSCDIFLIGTLTDSQVNVILERMGISQTSINKQLYELIKTPIHLDLFCRIYNNVTDINLVTNTYDLYHMFWENKIIRSYSNRNKIIKLLFEISQDMYVKQELIVNDRKYIDVYCDELDFLKSQNVLIASTTDICFFHQSFYDFVYARSFVSNGGDVLNYINNHSQAITIRASLKIVLSYLREYNFIEYINTIRKILLGDSNRFHIQYLVYSILGSEENPTINEMSFVEEFILCNQDRLTLFIPLCSNSQRWVEWIFMCDIISYIDDKHDRYKGALMSIIYTNLHKNTSLIINYIKNHRDLAIFSDENIIEYLCSLTNWDNDDALVFTKDLIPSFDIINYKHRRILQNILKDNKDFVFQNINLDTLLESDNISEVLNDYDFNKFIKKLIESSAYDSFLILFKFIDEAISVNKSPDHYVPRGFYKDEIFYNYYPYDKLDHQNVMNQFISMLFNFCLNDVDTYNDFYNKVKNSHSYIWNLILAITLKASPKEHQEKIVFILSKALDKMEYGTYDVLHKKNWELVKEAFPLVDEFTQKAIVDIIQKISLPYERTFQKYENRITYPHIHKTSYCFLRALPSAYIANNVTLNRYYGELARKYGDKDPYNWEKGRIMASYVSSSPLSSKAYEQMTHKQWKQSFYKYNVKADTTIYSESGFSGGIGEHSLAFQCAVEKQPEYFYSLVKDIIYDKSVAISYKLKGLWGLIKSNYSPKELISLYIYISKDSSCNAFTLDMMWMAQDLFIDQPMEEEVFNYIIDRALFFKYERNGYSNQVQKEAISPLILSYKKSKFHDRILETLVKVAENGNEKSKLEILTKVAYLNYIDPEKSLDIFLLCTRNVNPHCST